MLSLTKSTEVIERSVAMKNIPVNSLVLNERGFITYIRVSDGAIYVGEQTSWLYKFHPIKDFLDIPQYRVAPKGASVTIEQE